jgi:hypothetical protein
MHRVTGPNAKHSHSKFVRPAQRNCGMNALRLAQTQKTDLPKFMRPGAAQVATVDECTA